MQKPTPSCPKTAPFTEDKEMHSYFQSLPTSLQETMVQSGLQADSLQALQQCAKQFLQDNGHA